MSCQHCQAPLADGARFCGVCGKAQAATEPQTNAPASAAQEQASLAEMIGREIAGRYRILGKLGEGGMGTVYRAEQIALRRAVAIKLLKPDQTNDPALLRRFNAEAEVVAKLNHPNTVTIYDFGQDRDGSLFIAMELVDGRSLRQVIMTEGPLPVPRALQIAAQIAASIADAHTHTVIHRDLKPDNVMLQTRGRVQDVVRVLDFGIAKLRTDGRVTAPPPMTQAGDMLGTPYYMSPEQILGQPVDGRVDVYALGCMVYEMVTARMPFEAPTMVALLSKHLTELPPPPSVRRPDLPIPPALDAIVMAALAKDRDARPPTMDALADQLQQVALAHPADTLRQPPRAPQPGMHDTGPLSHEQTVATGPRSPVLIAPPTPAPLPVAYVPPQPQHGGHGPTAQVAPLPSPRPIARPASKAPIWIGVGVAVLVSSALAYQRQRAHHASAFGSADPSPSPSPTPPPDPAPPKVDPPKNDDPKSDPKREFPPGPPSANTVAGMFGVRLVIPPGFHVVQQNTTDVILLNSTQDVSIELFALDTTTDDVNVAAQRYAAVTNTQLLKVSDLRAMGSAHKAAAFQGMYVGKPAQKLVVAFPGKYPVALAIGAFNSNWTNTEFTTFVDTYLESPLVFP